MSGDYFNFTDSETELTNNFSLTCAAASINRPVMLPYSQTLVTTVRSIQTFFYILIFVFGMFLNTLVIVLVAKYKTLHTRSFAIALQVIVLNLILSCTALLLRPITAIANRWLFGEVICIITGYLYLTFLLLRALLMLVFVIDRFLTVFFLFSYPKHSHVLILTLSVATWVFSILFRSLGFPGILDCYSFVSTSFLCVHSSRCSPECAIAANVNLGILLGPATTIPIILYAALYWKAKRLKKRRASVLVTLASSQTTNAGHGIRKKEWKANITFFMLFVAVFVLTTPVVTLNLIFAAVTRRIGPSSVIYVIRSFISPMSSVLVISDPIVIMRNRDIKDILIKIKGRIFQKKRSTA